MTFWSIILRIEEAVRSLFVLSSSWFIRFAHAPLNRAASSVFNECFYYLCVIDWKETQKNSFVFHEKRRQKSWLEIRQLGCRLPTTWKGFFLFRAKWVYDLGKISPLSVISSQKGGNGPRSYAGQKKNKNKGNQFPKTWQYREGAFKSTSTSNPTLTEKLSKLSAV